MLTGLHTVTFDVFRITRSSAGDMLNSKFLCPKIIYKNPQVML